MLRHFRKLYKTQEERGRLLCVGLDPNYKELPEEFKQLSSKEEALRQFLYPIVDATFDVTGFYKLNSAFYERWGAKGFIALYDIITHINLVAPHVPVILDVKRGDVDHSIKLYAEAAFTHFGADAATVNPLPGREGLAPFLEREDKGIFILCHTSNPGATEFQNLRIDTKRKPLYMHVAENVSREWNVNKNCGLVVGATYPDVIGDARRAAPDLPILIPGIGAQDGDLEGSVHAGMNSEGQGIIVNASRSIIFASNGPDFAEAARREAERLNRLINEYRASKPQY